MLYVRRLSPVSLCLALVACAADPPALVRDFSVDPGYHVVGNQVLDKNGQPHLFHGVARPTLEWSAVGENISKADFDLMVGWKANVVRIALNQGFWLRPTNASGYREVVLQAVEWAKQAGLDVILDLHWSDRGDTKVKPDQQAMADQSSIAFWESVAETFKEDGRILFELYNEPKNIPWDAWLGGGTVVDNYYDNDTKQVQTVTFTAAGMQQLYDAIRAKGANNLVIAGGTNWAYDLSGVATHRIQGEGIMYATHPYDYGDKQPTDWDRAWGYLTETAPVIVTEFGSGDCSKGYTQALIDYADAHAASWTGWAWYVAGCSFPSLITDWNGTPSPPGEVVKAALEAYAQGKVITPPVVEPRPDAAPSAPDSRDAPSLDTQTLDVPGATDTQPNVDAMSAVDLVTGIDLVAIDLAQSGG
jgi:endoglucanase